MRGCGWRSWFRGAACAGLLGVAWVPGLHAQTQASAAALPGIGFLPQTALGGSTTGGVGVMAFPMLAGTGAGTAQAGSSGAVNPALDPLGLSYIYGPAAIPMTQAQAGLFMLSAEQRMLGLGNGQISGTRPGGQGTGVRGARGAQPVQASAAHPRKANTPGGLAASYFHRGMAAPARSAPHFQRPLRYFPLPQRGQ